MIAVYSYQFFESDACLSSVCMWYIVFVTIALKLIIKSTMEPYIETDLFAYNTAIAIALWYTLIVFIGIIIDIGTLYKFIASYSQF